MDGRMDALRRSGRSVGRSPFCSRRGAQEKCDCAHRFQPHRRSFGCEGQGSVAPDGRTVPLGMAETKKGGRVKTHCFPLLSGRGGANGRVQREQSAMGWLFGLSIGRARRARLAGALRDYGR